MDTSARAMVMANKILTESPYRKRRTDHALFLNYLEKVDYLYRDGLKSARRHPP